ncbi:GNAT family N-acetyltransferase [Candidatus Poribacteria bacterium]|nr:GNAT family N-acetyltransferase [Candidatus Poribacteria bacterium]MYI93655.1 GNAT family N-acetyltransferase [Candidatus Poribacteria bacterium]
MKTVPTLHTERLILRAFTLDDAQDVQKLAGERDIAATTSNLPHPYEDGMAETWINTHTPRLKEGKGVVWAITLKVNDSYTDTTLIGAIDINVDKSEKIGELGYWIGKPYWNSGYCSEAAKVVLNYGLDVLKLKSIHAFYFAKNPASGRVMQKIGMKFEQRFPKAVEKWGVLEDIIKYNIQNKTADV